MLHTLDPFIFRIYENFGIRWYGMAYLAGFVVGYLIISWLVKKQNTDFKSEMVGDFVMAMAIGTMVGGRLGYCLFYSRELFFEFSASFPFWGVLRVHEGGMASHGGIIGIILACIWFSKKHHVKVLYLYDLVAFAGPIGIFFGRIANFINGELIGRPSSPDFPLAVKFPQDLHAWPSSDFNRLPELSTIAEKVGVTRDQWLQWISNYRMQPDARNQVSVTIDKIITAVQEGNQQVKDLLTPLLTARHPSQLYGALAEGLFVFLILLFIWRKPRKPGIIGASFLFFYSIGRIVDEMFRTPDVQIGFDAFGLTRGQHLSAFMFIAGIVLLIFWNQRGSLPVEGWKKSSSVKLHRRY